MPGNIAVLHNANRDYIEIDTGIGDRIRRTARDIQRLEIINALELLQKPAPCRQWCVEPWIPHREVTLISGDGGIGKSTIALQLCAASAASLLWFGLEVRPGPALYVSCEDDIDELHFRLEQIKAHEPDADLSRLHILSLAGLDAILAKPLYGQMKPTLLFESIEKAIQQHNIRLLILDAAADVYGGEEVSRSQTRAFIQILRGLAIGCDCTVVLLAHPSVDGMKTGRGYSGSTQWNNSVRSRMYFSRATTSDENEPDPELRILELAKSNRGKIGQKVFMRWHDGCFVLDGAHDPGIRRHERDLKAESAYLELLDAYNDRGRHVSDKSGANYAPKVFSDDQAATGITKKQFKDAMNRLFTADRIKVEDYGPPSRLQRRIVRASHD
jgi:RecA-family ATPase